MKGKLIVRKIILIVILLLSIGLIKSNTYAIEIQTKEYSKQYEEWLELSEEQKQNTIAPAPYTIDIQLNNIQTAMAANVRLRGLNSQYDLRDHINLKVENQKQTSECWAFATCEALETNLALTRNITDVQYSTRHMNYATSYTFTDGVNEQGHNRDVKTGGNFFIATSYITRGQGPILEEDMPFVNSTEKINLSEIKSKTVQLKLEETIHFPTVYKKKQSDGSIQYTNGADKIYTDVEITSFRNSIKEHIMQYGAVMGYTYGTGEQYYSNTENYVLSKAYYCDEEQMPNHAISIIGWDDNYAVTNFNKDHRPTKPGAYIVKNSYGTEIEDSQGNKYTVFDDGYLYISYEDFLIEQRLFGIIKTNSIDHDTIYQYDELGCSEVSTNKNTVAYVANVFSRENPSKQEKLNEISMMASYGESYEIYINPTDGDLNQAKLEKVKTIPKMEKTGYYTIKLDTPIMLNGSKFVVAIKITSSNGEASIPVEAKVIANDLWDTATSETGQSFIGNDMNSWRDLKNENIIGSSNINACIKAFTTDIEDVDITINSTKYIIQNTNYISKIQPNTTLENFKRNITTNDSNYIVKIADKILTNTNFIGTGMKIYLSNGIRYILIVTGDVNGDGKITTTDIAKIKRNIIGLETLEIAFQKAGDVNNSNNVTLTDLVKVKKFLVGIEEF